MKGYVANVKTKVKGIVRDDVPFPELPDRIEPKPLIEKLQEDIAELKIQVEKLKIKLKLR